MTKVRKRHNAEFKSKVAIEAIKEQKTINELTAEYYNTPRKLDQKIAANKIE